MARLRWTADVARSRSPCQVAWSASRPAISMSMMGSRPARAARSRRRLAAAGRPRPTSTSSAATPSLNDCQRWCQPGNGRGQPLAVVPVTCLIANQTLSSAHGDPEVGPAKAGPLGQLDTLVEHGSRGRQVSEVELQPGKILQRSRLDLQVAGSSRPRSARRVQGAGAGRVVMFLDHGPGHEDVGLLLCTADGAGDRSGPHRTSGGPPLGVRHL